MALTSSLFSLAGPNYYLPFTFNKLTITSPSVTELGFALFDVLGTRCPFQFPGPGSVEPPVL